MATIFPASPTIGDTYQGYEWNGTAWVIIGVDLTTDYLTPTELQTYLNGNIDTHLIPDGNETRDLGEPSNKFRHLYLSSNSVYIGNTKLSATGGTVSLENTDVGPSSVTEIETTSGAQAKADAAAAAIVESAPETLNTLNELAAALNDDASFATTVTNSLASKQESSTGMTVVDNGEDPNFPRPPGVGAVYWIGSAEPVNAAAYDMWWSG
jgi:hypothetical protein